MGIKWPNTILPLSLPSPPLHLVYTMYHSPSTSLTVNVTTMEQSGDWVLVEWKYVDQPSIHDWIGLYTVRGDFKNETIDPTSKAPVKFQV